jgi:hypothetical protein
LIGAVYLDGGLYAAGQVMNILGLFPVDSCKKKGT